jgi:hypothetical protein
LDRKVGLEPSKGEIVSRFVGCHVCAVACGKSNSRDKYSMRSPEEQPID